MEFRFRHMLAKLIYNKYNFKSYNVSICHIREIYIERETDVLLLVTVTNAIPCVYAVMHCSHTIYKRYPSADPFCKTSFCNFLFIS